MPFLRAVETYCRGRGKVCDAQGSTVPKCFSSCEAPAGNEMSPIDTGKSVKGKLEYKVIAPGEMWIISFVQNGGGWTVKRLRHVEERAVADF
jgi:hypothetical protein